MGQPMDHVAKFKVDVTREYHLNDNSVRVKLQFPTYIKALSILPDDAIAIAQDMIRVANEIKGVKP